MKKFIFLTIFSLSLYAGDMIVKNSICGVDETVDIIKSIVKSKGMELFSVIDHSANAAKIGEHLNDSTLIIFGNPKLGTALMKQDITAGLDLPLHIFVFKNSNGVVKIAYRDGTWLVSKHAIHDSKLVKKMNDTLDDITNKAGQCRKD